MSGKAISKPRAKKTTVTITPPASTAAAATVAAPASTTAAAAPAPAPAATVPVTNEVPYSSTNDTAASASASKAVRTRGVKKEKKPIRVVAIITPNSIEGSFTPEPRKPLIVHLPFSNTEVKFSDVSLRYDPTPPSQPVPYEGDGTNYFQVNTDESSSENQIGVEQDGWKMVLEEKLKGSGLVEKTHEEEKASASSSACASAPPSTSPAPASACPAQASASASASYLQENFQRAQLLTCYASKPGELMKLPESTPVICFWCSNQFSNAPCFLPTKEENAVYHVYGNFCTPQCGLAYLLTEHLDSHVRWERMALLHRMYRPSSSMGGRLYPAPPRESLAQFGGVYSYEKYREVIANGQVRVDIHKPPMVSILGTLDTKPIDFYDSSLQNTFTQGFSMDRFKAWSEQGGALRLKRSKPLKDRDSTLDACIKISVKRG
jgi:hypothetical protein